VGPFLEVNNDGDNDGLDDDGDKDNTVGFICLQAPFCLLLFVFFVSLVAEGKRNTNSNKQLQTTTATMANFIPFVNQR
jgi:hypothetical protein